MTIQLSNGRILKANMNWTYVETNEFNLCWKQTWVKLNLKANLSWT